MILALDLYLRMPSAQGNSTHPEVQALSALLQKLPIRDPKLRDAHVRDPNGVGMKLANFRRFDPLHDGKGLSSGNHLEEEVWERFAGDPNRLHAVAKQIVGLAGTDSVQQVAPQEETPRRRKRESC